jgi:nicotinate-nucleotide--dimethylbenzimidazole phosphoribosyltransferase
MLEETGWRARRHVEEAIHREQFPSTAAPRPHAPAAAVERAGLPEIAPASTEARAAARAHQDTLSKPAGSLGRLEELGAWYAAARGRFPVEPPARTRLVVMAADHGVVAEGVSAYSSSVTAAMVGNFLAGGAAVNQLAAACDVELVVVDVGVAGDLSSLPRAAERRCALVEARVRAGTGNLRREAAMTRAEAEAALAVGARLAQQAARDGVELLAAGEMGIGNTTAASALVCALGGAAPEEAVGRGTGLDDDGVRRKVAVVRDALALHRPDGSDPLGALAALGGLEIAALAGLMLGGAGARLPLVVDGFISGAAALVAARLRPAVRDYLLLSHHSAERGQAALSAALDLKPLLHLDLRLGEGTGAVLAAQLVRAAVRVQRHMATFSTAGIAR